MQKFLTVESGSRGFIRLYVERVSEVLQVLLASAKLNVPQKCARSRSRPLRMKAPFASYPNVCQHRVTRRSGAAAQLAVAPDANRCVTTFEFYTSERRGSRR